MYKSRYFLIANFATSIYKKRWHLLWTPKLFNPFCCTELQDNKVLQSVVCVFVVKIYFVDTFVQKTEFRKKVYLRGEQFGLTAHSMAICCIAFFIAAEPAWPLICEYPHM